MAHGNSALGRTVNGFSTKPRVPSGWLPGGWKSLAGLLLIALLGVATFFLVYRPSLPVTVATPSAPRESKPPRPAYTVAEEEYIRALWPIHGEVQRVAVRMSLGQIFYLTRDIGQADLKGRVDEAVATFRQADKGLRALPPPASFQKQHADYLAAVRLFQGSAAEVLKMFKDGNEEHLRAAYPHFKRRPTRSVTSGPISGRMSFPRTSRGRPDRAAQPGRSGRRSLRWERRWSSGVTAIAAAFCCS